MILHAKKRKGYLTDDLKKYSKAIQSWPKNWPSLDFDALWKNLVAYRDWCAFRESSSLGSINKSRDKLTKRVNRVKVARLTALGNKLKKLCLWCRLGSKTLTQEPRAPNHRDHELSSVCRKEDELEKAFIFCLEYENETNKKIRHQSHVTGTFFGRKIMWEIHLLFTTFHISLVFLCRYEKRKKRFHRLQQKTVREEDALWARWCVQFTGW